MNVMLSHFYLNSGNEEDLQNFRYIIESAYTTYAIHPRQQTMTLRPFVAGLFRERARNAARWAAEICSTGRSCRQHAIPL